MNHSLCPIRIINHTHSIRKRGIARSIRMNHPNRPIRKGNLLPTVGVVIFDLFVWKMVGLHSVLVGYLGRLWGAEEEMIKILDNHCADSNVG